MKKTKKLEDLFPAMERDKMSKVYGGLFVGGSSQLKTVTVVSGGGGGDDGADDLLPGESQDAMNISPVENLGLFSYSTSQSQDHTVQVPGVIYADVSANVSLSVSI
jgi:hypothetical protein